MKAKNKGDNEVKKKTGKMMFEIYEKNFEEK